MSATTTNSNLHGFGRMRLDGTDKQFGDWRDDLASDGYAVVKGAIPREKALQYADQMYSWLENLQVATFRFSLVGRKLTSHQQASKDSTAMAFPLSTRTTCP